MEPFLDKTDHEKIKPALIKPNAFIKIGKDTVDQKLGFYFVKTKTGRPSNISLTYLLYPSRVNVLTVYSPSNKITAF